MGSCTEHRRPATQEAIAIKHDMVETKSPLQPTSAMGMELRPATSITGTIYICVCVCVCVCVHLRTCVLVSGMCMMRMLVWDANASLGCEC